MIRRKSLFVVCLVVVLGVSGFSSLEAQPNKGRWSLRAHVASVSPDGGSVTTSSDRGPMTLSVDGDTAFALELGFRLTERFSLEVEATKGTTDGELRLGGSSAAAAKDEIGFDFVTLKGSYHLRPDSRVDPYLAVGAGFFYNEDATFNLVGQTETVRFDDDNVWLLEAGVLVYFRERWLVSIRAQQALTLFEGEIAGQDLDFDPLMFSLGLGVRF